jgi:NADH-quinone oxidoreductase subunit H
MIDTIMAWFTPEVIANLIAVGKALVLLFGCVICAALLSFVERRLLALWQDRYGPNRTGPFRFAAVASRHDQNVFQRRLDAPFR